MRRDAIGLQVSLDVEGRRALVIGGGAEAEDKVRRLRDAGAVVVVAARQLTPALEEAAARGEVEWLARDVEPGDYRGAELLLLCERDPSRAAAVYEAAAGLGAMAWCCDAPEQSHLAMPALARLGRARVAVSTGGAAPALAGRVREALERDLGARFAAFVEELGAERERLRREEPDEARRRERLRQLVAGFQLQLAARYPEWAGEPASR